MDKSKSHVIKLDDVKNAHILNMNLSCQRSNFIFKFYLLRKFLFFERSTIDLRVYLSFNEWVYYLVRNYRKQAHEDQVEK